MCVKLEAQWNESLLRRISATLFKKQKETCSVLQLLSLSLPHYLSIYLDRWPFLIQPLLWKWAKTDRSSVVYIKPRKELNESGWV